MRKDYSSIIKLINEGFSKEEIMKALNISSFELHKILVYLRHNGINFINNYYLDGEVNYELIKNLNNEIEWKIITEKEDNEINLMVISDLHLGSLYDNVKYLEKIYNYCVDNNIHYILNCGDLVEGDINQRNIRIHPLKQIDYALRVHPFDKSIYSFLVLGNHDYSLLDIYGINVMNNIKERRDDIIPIGFGEGIVSIKNDMLVMQHPILYPGFKKGIYNKTVIIRGHGHEAKNIVDTSNLVIYVPSLSNLNFNKSHFPGAVQLKLKMRCGLIEFVNIEELTIINKNLYITSDANIYVGNNKSFKEKNEIKNETYYPKTLRKAKK